MGGDFCTVCPVLHYRVYALNYKFISNIRFELRIVENLNGQVFESIRAREIFWVRKVQLCLNENFLEHLKVTNKYWYWSLTQDKTFIYSTLLCFFSLARNWDCLVSHNVC